MPAKAYNQYACWAEEATWATEVPRTKFSRIFKGSNLKHQAPREAVTRLERRDPAGRHARTEFGTGRLIVPLAATGFELLLKHAMGNVATSGVNPNYTHVFTLTDGGDATGGAGGAKPSLCTELHEALPDAGFESLLMLGAMVAGMSLDFAVNEELKVAFDLIGQKVIREPVTASPTFPNYDTLTFRSMHCSVRSDTATPGSLASLGQVKRATLNLNTNLRQDRAHLGSQYIAQPIQAPGKRTISGQIDREWEGVNAAQLFDDFVAGAALKLEFQAQIDANTSIVILLPNVTLLGDTPEPEEGGEIPQMVPWEANYDATDTAMKITVKNQVATV
jgi:hypothetical protein